MPEMSPFGWFHTIMGMAALLSGAYSILRYKIIASENASAKIFLLTTVITSVSALMIYKQGSFGIAHMLAVVALIAVVGGMMMERRLIFGWLCPYFQAISYSALFLFHMIPAITDGLRRLPVDDPIAKSFEDPLILGFYVLFLAAYIVGVIAQMFWIKKNKLV
ncbi:hypothetical protein OAE05_01955 [Gammaproteobacteria bacterium]|nr:hypothetical protein [Gammaproteobacteria bacterium]MDB9997096.1 hypothetical protein [Gammaproteobacteria bacterium]|tara:strand:- start:162 stop:650 length:489 start_codon:yes stop_codon:yes gene_type:complete